jgi:hypothetical protein
MILLTAALVLVLLHRADGGPVHVAPSQITSLHDRPEIGVRVVNRAAKCVIWLADGKVLAVLEPCDVVRKLFVEAGSAR